MAAVLCVCVRERGNSVLSEQVKLFLHTINVGTCVGFLVKTG